MKITSILYYLAAAVAKKEKKILQTLPLILMN